MQRIHTGRMSNGDENKLKIIIKNNYGFKVKALVIDELPFQLNEKDLERAITIKADDTFELPYSLVPKERGEYHFGNILVFAASPFGLVKRKFNFPSAEVLPVYPSYIQMRRYSLLASANKFALAGARKVRRLGHSLEFEQIKEYVRGDDVRTINWKATARKSQLMVNNYTDEKSQQIYCLVDKGRAMKMPFEGLSLLDYAINASLVLLNVALVKQDKAGLITFAQKLDSFVPAEKKSVQMQTILETLYRQQTNFMETDYEMLYAHIRNKIKQRSLLILFTNFESLTGLQRQLPYLRQIARYHLLVVVFFENTETKQLLESDAEDLEGIYIKTIAEKFAYEKKQIVKELHKYGIISILTTPQNVTVNTINKYMELKARQAI